MTEWSTKVIAQTMAATTGKEGKSLQTAVAKIRLNLDGEDDVHPEPGADTVYEAAPGARVEGSSGPANSAGSYEAFMQGFRL